MFSQHHGTVNGASQRPNPLSSSYVETIIYINNKIFSTNNVILSTFVVVFAMEGILLFQSYSNFYKVFTISLYLFILLDI